MVGNSNSNVAFDIKFINPKEIVDQLSVAAGSQVADFGCGMGHFSLEMSKRIGENGLVYAFDILPEKLESVISGVKGLGMTNLIAKRANLEKEKGSGLENESVDWVVMKDMLFQNKNKTAILAEAYRILKPGGKALIIEWKMEDASIGPPQELRLSEETLKILTEKAGLKETEKIEAGDFHFATVFVK
jgi:ubiquinone/menaquinone biosynthesis C-methylase UbiE